MNEKLQQVIADSKAIRWFTLSMVSLTMLAAYYFVDSIAPLQSLLEQGYGWKPGHYGFFSASEYMLNVCGFLILSGIILDKMGIRFTGLTACAVMLTGALLKTYALTGYFRDGGFGYEFFSSFWTDMPATAKLASLGYAIFGIGVEMAGITTSRAVVKWFQGRELALAMGMQLATARLGASVAFFFSAPLAGYQQAANGAATGSVLNPLYLGVALLSIGLLTFFVYTFFDRKLDRQTGRLSDEDPSEQFHLRDLGKIITNPGFLAIAALCVLFYSGVFPFLKYAVYMMQNKLGVSAEVGGMISGLLPVGTILLTPIFGAYLDKKGKGASIMILGSALLTAAHLTFAFIPLNMFIAVTAIIVLGIAFSLIPASMWPSVPKIVEERYLGSAYALVFWIQNIGLMFFPWLVGQVLEATNPGVAERITAGDTSVKYNYTYALLIFAVLGVCAIALAFVLKATDKKRGYGLELPNKKKKPAEQAG
ncbi:MAG TPA: MFS transporter [Myxococcota bacterium]|nr:MFS transporter [Myxococcota bacterium]HRY95839.1 MFS transporter [Myxococcota bacterium]HSA22806.1 MFS transporter [Myxococcota bacterium]